MAFFVDQTGEEVLLAAIPERIVSVVPSQTELLAEMGLETEVVGITKFCIHPEEWFRNKVRVGGTKKLDIEKILSLNPDIIFANKEENTREDIEALRKHVPVWVSDIRTIDDAIMMINSVGDITGKIAESNHLVQAIRTAQHSISAVQHPAVYLIWNDPVMVAGNDTFINEMMMYAGFSNVIQSDRYPVITDEEIRRLSPEYILLSSEPFPFSEKHKEGYEARFPGIKVILVDGEYFSWYGSRMKDAFGYFRDLYSIL